MSQSSKHTNKKAENKPYEGLFSVTVLVCICCIVCIGIVFFIYFGNSFPQEYDQLRAAVVKGVTDAQTNASTTAEVVVPSVQPLALLDIPAYNAKLLTLANYAKGTDIYFYASTAAMAGKNSVSRSRSNSSI